MTGRQLVALALTAGSAAALCTHELVVIAVLLPLAGALIAIDGRAASREKRGTSLR